MFGDSGEKGGVGVKTYSDESSDLVAQSLGGNLGDLLADLLVGVKIKSKSEKDTDVVVRTGRKGRPGISTRHRFIKGKGRFQEMHCKGTTLHWKVKQPHTLHRLQWSTDLG